MHVRNQAAGTAADGILAKIAPVAQFAPARKIRCRTALRIFQVGHRTAAIEQEPVDPVIAAQRVQTSFNQFVHLGTGQVVKSAVSSVPLGHRDRRIGTRNEHLFAPVPAKNRPVAADKRRNGEHHPEPLVMQCAHHAGKIAEKVHARFVATDRRLPSGRHDQRPGRIARFQNLIGIIAKGRFGSLKTQFEERVVNRSGHQFRGRSVPPGREILMAANQVGLAQRPAGRNGFDLPGRRFDQEVVAGIRDAERFGAPDVAAAARDHERCLLAASLRKVDLLKRRVERHRTSAGDKDAPPFFAFEQVDTAGEIGTQKLHRAKQDQ